MITEKQLKVARCLLGIEQDELADLCGLSQATIQRLETGGIEKARPKNIKKLIAGLTSRGILLAKDGVNVLFLDAVDVQDGVIVTLEGTARTIPVCGQPPDE